MNPMGKSPDRKGLPTDIRRRILGLFSGGALSGGGSGDYLNARNKAVPLALVFSVALTSVGGVQPHSFRSQNFRPASAGPFCIQALSTADLSTLRHILRFQPFLTGLFQEQSGDERFSRPSDHLIIPGDQRLRDRNLIEPVGIRAGEMWAKQMASWPEGAKGVSSVQEFVRLLLRLREDVFQILWPTRPLVAFGDPGSSVLFEIAAIAGGLGIIVEPQGAQTPGLADRLQRAIAAYGNGSSGITLKVVKQQVMVSAPLNGNRRWDWGHELEFSKLSGPIFTFTEFSAGAHEARDAAFVDLEIFFALSAMKMATVEDILSAFQSHGVSATLPRVQTAFDRLRRLLSDEAPAVPEARRTNGAA